MYFYLGTCHAYVYQHGSVYIATCIYAHGSGMAAWMCALREIKSRADVQHVPIQRDVFENGKKVFNHFNSVFFRGQDAFMSFTSHMYGIEYSLLIHQLMAAQFL